MEEGWQMAPVCLFWYIWKEHNYQTFNREETSDQQWKETLIMSLLECSMPPLGMTGSTLLHFVD